MPAPAFSRRPTLLFLAGLAAAGLRAAEPQPGLESVPLAVRSIAPGATMFTAMSPEQTGIVTENSYADPKMWGERYQEFALGAIGTGVAIGDYDNDGRPDIFVVNKTGRSRLFRNLGNWKFEDTTERAGLAPAGGALEQGLSWVKGLLGGGPQPAAEVEAWKQGAAFADINNDGWLDLYVCRFNAPNLLYVNQGDGTFKEEAAARGLAVKDASGMGAFCDYDRDGWLDVYVQTNMLDSVASPGGQRDLLFRNRGDGTFEDVTARAGISGENLAHSVVWWDFDNDGWPDIYVANDFGPPDRLYRNNRDGTFTDVIHRTVPQMPYSAMGADLGDVNNDGLVDFLVADMATTTHEKDQRGMASSRALSREDSDSPVLAPQMLRNALYLNTGTDRLLEGAALAGLAATDWTWSVRFEDLDNDGWLDLHITNGMNREYQNADLRDQIILVEDVGERLRVMKASPALEESNLAYRNLGGVRFEEVGARWGLDQHGVSFGAAFGDLDGDGDLDLVFTNYEAGATVLRNDSANGNRAIVALRGTRSNRFGIGAVVTIETAAGVQVRPLVSARGYLSSSEPVAHFGLGDETIIAKLTVEWPGGHIQTFRDLPAGRRFTITEPHSPPPQGGIAARPERVAPRAQFVDVSDALGLSLRSEESFHGEQQPLVPFRFDRRGPALAVGDLGGDRDDDLAIGGTGRQPAQLLAGGTRFAPVASLAASPLDSGPILLFDADGDGDNDLLETRAGTNQPAGSPDYQPVLYLNDGGTLRPAPQGALPPVPMSAGAVAAADFDRDGRLDVFLGARVLPGRYPLPPRSALLRNTGGRFEDVTDTLAPGLREVGLVTSAIWSDVDLDGWPDLLVALEWGTVRLFHNDKGRGFTDRSEEAGFTATGWWTSLATGDFNGDGVPDFVAGNLGLNTIYRASEAAPAVLYHGSFGGSAPLAIEGHYENGRLLPRAARNDLGARIPNLRRRFQRNNAYARATLEEIVGADRLAAARRFEATELRSGVYLSQPGGTWRFEPLPHLAQISPLQGIAAGDFDGDGHADIYAVQNSHAPVPFIGRFEGGVSQLLRGDGRGGFVPVPPADSGLVVPGDAKALVVLDLDQDGWPDFLVSRNNGTTLVWRNAGVPGRRSLCVRLEGPAGNPTGIGARVVLEMADGSTQSAEIHAGGGYYSQSAPAVFFGSTDANPPRRVQVRWPDGSTSALAVPAESSTIVVSH